MSDFYFVALTNHQSWLSDQKQRAEESRKVAENRGDYEIEQFFQDQAENYSRAIENLEHAVEQARLDRDVEHPDSPAPKEKRYLWGLRDDWGHVMAAENSEAAWRQMMTQPAHKDLVVVRSEFHNGEWSDWEEVDQLGDTFAESICRYAAADLRPNTPDGRAVCPRPQGVNVV